MLYHDLSLERSVTGKTCENKKHLKNVGPIRYCEPPLHCQSPGVASRTPAIATRRAVSTTTTTTTTTRDRGDRYGPMEWAQKVVLSRYSERLREMEMEPAVPCTAQSSMHRQTCVVAVASEMSRRVASQCN